MFLYFPAPVPEETYVEEYEEGGYECEVMEFDEEEEEKKLIEKVCNFLI